MKFNKNIIWYATGEIFNKVLMFFFLPLAALFLTIEEFGVVAIVIPFIQTMQGVITAGLPISILKFYNDYKNKHRLIDFNILIYYLLIFLFFLIIISSLQFLGFLEFISIGAYKINDYVFLLFLTIFLSGSVTILLQKYQALRLVKLFVITNFSSRFLIILLLIVTIIFL